MSLGEGAAAADTTARHEGSNDEDETAVVEHRDGGRLLAAAMTAATRPEDISASDGRERVSATTLSTPERCRRSVVNSEMKERCRVCRGERSAEDLIAPHNGL